MPTTAAQIRAILSRLEPAIRSEFLEMVREAVGAANLGRVEQLLSVGNYSAIPVVLGITPSAFAELLEEFRATYVEGGRMGQRDIRTTRGARAAGAFQFRFNTRNLRAEGWIATHGATFVTRTTAEMQQAIRVAIEAGTRAGNNPRQTALDIVGRINTQTGRRTGGIVGLTQVQSSYVATARAELMSGDAKQLRSYLMRKRRDRNLDGFVYRALQSGSNRLSRADADRLVGRYADRLLLLRGETIARTEALAAFNAGTRESYSQLVEEGRARASSIKKTWRNSHDARVRDNHITLGGQQRAFDQAFLSPSGAYLMHPGDSSLGAGAEDIANCRCISQTRVDFIGEALANGG